MFAWLDMFLLRLQFAFRKFVTSEEGEVNIVTIVVLIGIAVMLAILFRRQIAGLLGTLFGQITTNATDAVNQPA